MGVEKHLIKVIQSVYFPSIISCIYTSISNYFLSHPLSQQKQHYKAEKSLHCKAAKTLVSSVISDHMCASSKSNPMLNTACTLAVKNTVGYGVQKVCDIVDNAFISRSELYNHESSLQDELNTNIVIDLIVSS